MALVAACTPELGKPAVRQMPNPPRIFDNSDPAVLVYGGHTYLFGSTNNRKVPVREITDYTASLSSSQTQWAQQPRDAMPTRPAWVDSAESQIWAPSVARIGSQFVLYFAGHHAGATTDERNDLCIGRAVSTNPMGPYTPEAWPVYCGLPAEGAVMGQPASNRFGRGALDPEVFRAPDGKLYLLVALSRTKSNIASVPLKSDGRPSGLNAPASVLASQSMPWHDGHDDGVLSGGFLENPSMLFDAKTDTFLLFFSAGQWSTTYYNTSFARCGSPTGDCVQDTRGPFLKSGNGRGGPGGLTAYISNAGVPRVAYASWETGHESPSSNPAGIYSRQTHWAVLRLGDTSDPALQTVSLG